MLIDFPSDECTPKFCGHIMRGDAIAACVVNDEVTVYNELAPLYIQRTGNFLDWLSDRCADVSRSNMRAILRCLGLPFHDAVRIVKTINAASVVDTFWIKPDDSQLTYADVRFMSNPYFKAALASDAEAFSMPPSSTPELTNIGSFEKGWNLGDGEWYLYKTGTDLQLFSEIFTATLGKLLGLDVVDYWIDSGYSVCRNFVPDGLCFEPAKSLVGANVDYFYNCETIAKIPNVDLIKQYLDILFLDAITRNPDRHEFNYGFITSESTIIMAPNFDNNLALFAFGVPKDLSRRDVMVSDFCRVIERYEYDLPIVAEDIIYEAYKAAMAQREIDVTFDVVKDFCMNAFCRIKGTLHQ